MQLMSLKHLQYTWHILYFQLSWRSSNHICKAFIMDTRQRYHFTAQKPASNTFEILDLDIDPSACGDACCGSQLPLWSSEKKSYSASMPLYKYSEIPDFMKGNSYIINGYRGEMNFNFCIKRFVNSQTSTTLVCYP